ncbi:hypothetical protein PLICRDRAFT_40606 [Plicaturopsis crispa FD-325 SS-3]|nr:hypothetical protein PLICRDRAFT_40606 [Plicaturopsis crispa FD-325 SS-3]
MSEANTRPSLDSVKNAYDRLFRSGLSLPRIKDTVIGGRFFSAADVSSGLPGRSIMWKLFLVSDEPLDPPTTPTPPLRSLRSSRKAYTDLLLEKMRAPDGGYEEGFFIPGLGVQPRTDRTPGNLEQNNPLSLHDENPWNEWFASVELRKTILQDVERTFPDIGYFRDVDVQVQLANILFIYSVTHPDVGYRQGMHELLAPLYYAVDYDSLQDEGNAPDDDAAFRELCSRTWVAADAWALFNAVMNGTHKWYEWREPPASSSSAPTSTSPFATHVQLSVPNGQVDMKPYVAPIVQACNKLQSVLLKSVDPALWKSLQAAGIEPQIYGIRWLRLLFTREFTMNDSMMLWDGLFACDPTFELAPWICVAMLIRIRNNLIPSDYSGQLTLLLRYPPRPANDTDDSPHHTMLLLRQALALQMSPNTSTGATVVIENHNLLNIPIEVPEPPPPPVRRRPRPGEKGQPQASGSQGRQGGGVRGAHTRQQSSPPMGYPEMLARGLIDRGESLGINKTLMSAVSELRRNLPELASSLVRTTPPSSSANYAAFPLVDERPVEERPPWEPRTRFEIEKEMSEMRSRNKLIGDSVSWIVDVLLQDEGDAIDAARLAAIRSRKREALESLSYVRDVLHSDVRDLDEERLLGEEEYRKRKSMARLPPSRRNESTAVDLPMPRPTAPTRAPVAESRPKAPAARNDRPTFTPTASSQKPSASPPQSPPLAPWNYTRSSFSSAESPVATLPRLPPRTSTTFHPHRVTPPSDAGRTTDSTRKQSKVQSDPLGALP